MLCETPLPEFITMPVVRQEAWRKSTAWIATYIDGR